MIKKILKTLGLLFIVLLLVLIANTFFLSSKQLPKGEKESIALREGFAERLSEAIQLPTVTWEEEEKIDTAQFTLLHELLKKNYPLTHQSLERKKMHRHALLYEWKGSDANLKPLVLLAHQDVVPADPEAWQTPPFSGKIDDKFIWGRGSLDDKGSLISILEAVENLLLKGFKPERSIYLAFGDDEEISGNGAKELAAYLENKGVDAWMVLDEGMVIVRGLVPMISKPVALVGTSEKGYLTLKFSCNVDGGHSSTPQAETAISILSEAMTKITDQQPTARFSEPVNDFLKYLGPETAWPARIVFANRWLFDPVIKSIYTSSSSGNALVRTTTAPTIMRAGFKDNVLPRYAEAFVNYRLLPGDDSTKIINHLKKAIDDSRVNIKASKAYREAAIVSPIETEGFKTLQEVITASFDETLTMPTLMLAGSDSRNYTKVSRNIYRFAPYKVDPEDLDRIHGLDERILIQDYEEMIRFYYALIKASSRD